MASRASRVRVVRPQEPSPSHAFGVGPSLSRDAGERLKAKRETLLVYRDRLAPMSEVGFLRRFYVGFERLAPVWLGRRLEPGASALTGDKLRLGRFGPLGALDRA